MKKILSTFLVLAALGCFGGCASTEPENLSERPWNSPKNWEHGLPTGMWNQR